MLCFRFKRLLIPYSEGDLDRRSREKVERHLAACANCALDLGAIRSISGALTQVEAPSMEPAPDLWARVSARVANEAPMPTRSRLRATQALSAGAVAVLVAAAGLNMLHTLWTQPQATAPAPPETSVAAESEGSPPVERIPEAVPAPSAESTKKVVELPYKVQPRPSVESERARGRLAKGPAVSAFGGSTGRPSRSMGGYAWDDGARHRGVTDSWHAAKPTPAPPRPAETPSHYYAEGGSHRKAAPTASSADKPDRAGLHSGVVNGSMNSDYSVAPGSPRGDVVATTAKPRVGGELALGVGSTGDVLLADGSATFGLGYAPACSANLTVGVDMDADASVVDELTETEGVRTAALFTYP